MSTEGEAVIKKRQIVKIGGAYYISLPKEWLKTYNLESGNELLTVANADIRIVNPKHEKEVYGKVSKIAKEVKI